MRTEPVEFVDPLPRRSVRFVSLLVCVYIRHFQCISGPSAHCGYSEPDQTFLPWTQVSGVLN